MHLVYRSEDDTMYALPTRGLAQRLRPEEIPQADVRDDRDC